MDVRQLGRMGAVCMYGRTSARQNGRRMYVCTYVSSAEWVPNVCMDVRQLGRMGISEVHTPELQSPVNLVCRALLEKKKLHHKALLTV